jgi:hypothetical protein
MTDPTKSSIPRCLHGCYSPHGTPGGTDNDACSCCTPIVVPQDYKHVIVRNKDGKLENVSTAV